ncbi:hypothetical protein CSE_04770 [Caldisericum exile AZM16c01]|uniref:Uncharacterized protein n=1 Tax=Caldisericum exile (strain DSM 21853 / NBRC 104410 / AZM16c01) TaxID=511051 RepID=A0A7U6GDV6_CALEA|nr:hypothetical protein CSE_04770 [Caldisericum exile AZM16c01]
MLRTSKVLSLSNGLDAQFLKIFEICSFKVVMVMPNVISLNCFKVSRSLKTRLDFD